MKLAFLGAFFGLFLAFSASAQSACPPDLVCITPAAARKALIDGDKVIALEAAAVKKDKAFDDLTKQLNDMRTEFAKVSGENTILKQDKVADRALIQVFVQNFKARNKYGLLVF